MNLVNLPIFPKSTPNHRHLPSSFILISPLPICHVYNSLHILPQIHISFPDMTPKSSVLLQRITHPSAALPHPLLLHDPIAASSTPTIPDQVACYHIHAVAPNQCFSAVTQKITAPVSTVWSVVRRFDNPQAYKHFVKSCHVLVGNGDVGTLREVNVISGLPAANSTERLEILDDERHVLSFSVVGGDHRLSNYRSVTTLHPAGDGDGTVVVESYVVDVPQGNTKEDTCLFADTIVLCNLQSLAQKAEDLASRNGDTDN